MKWRSIAEQLDEALEATGKDCDLLALETGIPGSMIRRYMFGDVRKIPIDRLQSICGALNLDVYDVLGWTMIE